MDPRATAPQTGAPPLKLALALMGAGLLVCLILAEVGARIWSGRENVYDVEMWRYSRLVKQPDPNPRRVFRHRPNVQTSLYGVPVRTNSAGYRNEQEFTHAKPPGVRRVILLGDSITMGWGVRFEHTFAGLLPELLGSRASVEVINTGVGNYTTVQEVETLAVEGLDYSPDWIVLGYTTNDAEPPPDTSGFKAWSNSRFLLLMWTRMDRLRRLMGLAHDWRNYYHDLYQADKPGWKGTQEALTRLGVLARENHIPVLLVQIPEIHVLGQDYPFREENALVRAVAQGAGLSVLDLVDAFPAEDPMSLWVSEEDPHPNAVGHMIIAREIAARLRDEGF